MTNSRKSSAWRVEYPDDFPAALSKLFTKRQLEKIVSKIEELPPLQNPISHPQVIPLTGERLRGKYRMKFGQIRIVFSLDTQTRAIQIELIVARKETTYKHLARKH